MPKLSQRHLTANSWSFVTVICIFICIYYICVYIICIIHDVIFSIYKSWTHWITDWMADDRLLRAVRPKFDPRCKFLFEWKGTKLSKRQKGHTVVILFDFYCYYHFFFSSSSSSFLFDAYSCWWCSLPTFSEASIGLEFTVLMDCTTLRLKHIN